jgi:ceramide glucosyltransferase
LTLPAFDSIKLHGVRNVTAILGLVCLGLGLLGAIYGLLAALLVLRRLDRTPDAPPPQTLPSVDCYKPLKGAPPGLAAALASYHRQTYAGPWRVIYGLADPADPAMATARTLAKPDDIVVSDRQHGANRKVSNLLNIAAVSRGEIIVLSDADIAVPPDYLSRIVQTLSTPGVGAVSLLYRGVGVAGFMSRLAAMAIDYNFLPNAVLGMSIGLAKPCFGSTIALTRQTLDAIGGLEAIKDHLADDYELGARVRALGQDVAVPGFLVTHQCDEPDLRALFTHELRWARTIRWLNPVGHYGSFITHPLPFGLLAVVLTAGAAFAWGGLTTILLLRWTGKSVIDRATRASAGPWWVLPGRDLVSFGVFLASLFGNRVDWQGRAYRIGPGGVLNPI